MSYLDKPFNINLENIKYFEYDLDYILAASTLLDHVTVTLTPELHDQIKKNKIYSKQFLGLAEFGIKTRVAEKLPHSPVMHIHDAQLINYDELVDWVVNFDGGKHDRR